MCRIALTLLFLSATASAQGPEWTSAYGPQESGSVIAAQSNGSIYSVRNGYLLISWNGGRTWTTRSAEPIGPRELRILSPESMLAVNWTGVIRTDNNGATWASAGLDGSDFYDLAVGPNGTWYAATGEKLYKSDTEGDSWELLPSDHDPDEFRFQLVDVMIADDNTVLVTWLRDFVVGCVSLRRSVNGGHAWRDVDEASCTSGLSMVLSSDGELFIPSYDPTYELAGIPADALFRSTNDGVSWDRIYEQPTTGAFRASWGELLIGRPGGIEWGGPALPVAAVYSFVETWDGTLFANSGGFSVSAFDPPFFSYNGSGTYRLEPGDTTWAQAGNQVALVAALAIDPTGAFYTGTDRFLAKAEGGIWSATGLNVEVNDVLVLTDGRVLVANPSPHGARELLTGELLLGGTSCAHDCGVAALAETVDGSLLVTGVGGIYAGEENHGIYRSVDDGETWTLALPDVGNVHTLNASSSTPILAGTHGTSNVVNPGIGAYRSLDDGETWAPFIDGLTNTEVHSVFSSGGMEYAGTEDGVFVSSGGGAWSEDGLAGDTVYAFVDAGDGLLAGTSSGLFRRTAPNEWRRYGTGLEDRSVLSLLVTEFEGQELIVAGTDEGVYLSRPGLITVGQEQPVPTASTTRLHPPFPNPARNLITLRFDLEQASHVRIRAFDTLGREVAQPVNQLFPAGAHQFEWPVGRLPSGAYLLRFEAGDMRLTQRVTVLR